MADKLIITYEEYKTAVEKLALEIEKNYKLVYDKKVFLNSLTTWGYKKILMAVDIWNDNLRINGWKYQTKINLSEDFGGSNWIYSIVNDSVIEKSKSTGGNTSYFYKTDKSYLDELLEFDECNY